MDWLLRVQASPGDPLLRADLEAWCDADPDHAHAWARAQKAWTAVGEVQPRHAGEWPAKTANGPSGRLAALMRRLARSRRLNIATGLALAACLMLLFVPVLMSEFTADYATGTAELREVPLADGSRAYLAPQSALDVHYSSDRRAVALLSGEAFFEVAANAERPFVVTADGVEVAVVGTAFDVRLSSDAIVVAVRNGIVEIRGEAGYPPVRARLSAGDRVKVDRATGRLRRDEIVPDQIAAWRHGHLFVDGATVAEVVDKLRRYRTGWIVVDSRLLGQRVTGLFELGDTDRALDTLVQPFGGRVSKVTPFLRILSGP